MIYFRSATLNLAKLSRPSLFLSLLWKSASNLILKKCEYLVFNAKHQRSDLDCGYFSVKLVSSIRWLGISICSCLSAFRSCGLNDIKSKLKIGYAKIVPNRGRFSRKALSRLYSTYCDHSQCCERSYRNQKIIRKFCATDIIFVYIKNSMLVACQRLGPYHPLIRLY